MKKKDIIIHFEWFDLFRDSELTEDEVNKMLYTAISYVRDDIEPDFDDRALKAVWSVMKDRIDYDCEMYNKRTENSRRNGAKGGRPKKAEEKPTGFSGFSEKPTKPTGFSGFSEKPTKPDSVSVVESDVCNGSLFSESCSGSCLKDDHDTVREYFKLNGYKSDPDRFIDYNLSKGNDFFDQPKRWQAAARMWEQKEKDMHPPDRFELLDKIIAGEVTYDDVSGSS